MSVGLENLERGLGIEGMVYRLKRSGWSTEDLKEYRELLLHDNFAEVERFAGGALKEIADPAWRDVMVEATIYRLMIEKTDSGTLAEAEAVECPHGYIGTCRRCRDLGSAVVRYE